MFNILLTQHLQDLHALSLIDSLIDEPMFITLLRAQQDKAINTFSTHKSK